MRAVRDGERGGAQGEGEMRVLVCGSRDWTNEDAIADALAEFTCEPEVLVIHGDARGADRMAGKMAAFYGFEVRAVPADWDMYGKRAGYLRNMAMLDMRPDVVLAFQCNDRATGRPSRGTQHTIDEAQRRGIPVEVVR